MNGLFFDPLAATATHVPVPQQASAPHSGSSLAAPEAMPRQPRRQGPDEKTLRAASLLKVSRDLEHLLRQRGR